ncbi:Lrp/AsnC family transcriptional regulator [Sinorhizobium numidicum]|uniref:Lrp/AsnC family transcriptional regulator n=1 Tax=Sinorhizobium numidicum TaxID=680248 RepID=A0ABY8CZS1_9HYPH|nr:Lrp/AsnC family transcriptional regulator [Sinorhizobium numidicum]WEX76262.1 Lrp/AsnC family transcriptional regulator [Sinorhizobium numidicum]WEX82922.1 Lrp/AsnC family transcriptional regulator [Sinorhizobium numidicum]
MNSKTEDVQLNDRPARSLDAFDRKILGALTEDARLTYAEIGQAVGLSAPAVHERVKRLKAAGALIGTAARIDATSVGKPFLAFVHVDADGWGKSQRMMKLKAFPEVEEIHSVAGDTCVVLKVRTANAQAMEQFLSQLYVLPGVRGTRSFVVLSTYLERPVQAGITTNWPLIPLPPE